MSSINIRRTAVFLLVAFAALGMSAQTEVTKEPWSKKKQAATEAYWTRDRIATAPAMSLLVDTGSAEIDATALDVEAIAGPPGLARAGRPERGSAAFHRSVYPQDWQNERFDWGSLYQDDLTQNEPALAEQQADVPAGSSQVYTNYPVNRRTALWKINPHKWMGKFTFTTPSGSSSCSATAISKNHVVTAAHCVYDTPSRNKWYSNKAFTPAFRNGNAPYGTFATTGCTILTAWINLSGGYSINSWARHDVAVCNVGRNSARKTLNQAVGWAGRSWNYGYSQLHFNSGYPARNYNDSLLSSPAQYLRSCTAESFRQTTNTLGSGCYYGRGISGGSWLRRYKANYVSGNVNSVNSGLFIGSQNLYGARFTSSNIVPICNATGC